ncbi:NUDIX hydrolase [Candidatus Parcubacteria bacterium]|nr:NUDIX hydrolase [Candidatus Parcubacteria bacterium]
MKKIIIASGPVIVENDKVLLNKHGDTNFWKFCGGRVENYDQNLFEAAEREVMEEMDINIIALNKKPYLMHVEKETPNGKIDVILVHFLCERVGKINPDNEIDEWDWIDINKLSSHKDLGPNIIPTLTHFEFIK